LIAMNMNKMKNKVDFILCCSVEISKGNLNF